MKQMYKVLISISLLLILASVLVNALETDEKGNINPNVQENIAKGKPTPTPTPTPTPIPYSAIFTMTDTQLHPVNFSIAILSNWTEITNSTFYLPENSYVYVESSGLFANHFSSAGTANIKMEVDTEIDDRSTIRSYYLASPAGGCNTCYAGFQTSHGYYLSAGIHTIHLSGIVTGITEGIPAVTKASITAIANENGDIQIK